MQECAPFRPACTADLYPEPLRQPDERNGDRILESRARRHSLWEGLREIFPQMRGIGHAYTCIQHLLGVPAGRSTAGMVLISHLNCATCESALVITPARREIS